jgi:glycosyltransferase involved in cell wall biosynthesis
MDVFALSSDSEQMPLVVLEAMSAGLPVVSTDVGDVRQMVAPSNQQWIVPPADSTAYAHVVQTLALDGDLRLRLGSANRRHCLEKYTVERMIASYVALYGELAGRQRG